MLIYKDIFIAFFRSGMLGYGGGLSAIPLMQREVVHIFKWMSEEEFADILALSNTLPGPINTKLSGYIGYRVGGLIGLISAVIATVIPTVIMMILLFVVLNSYKDQPWVHGMSKAVIPVAAVMIGVLAWDFIKLAKKSMGIKLTVIITVISIFVMEILGLHPAILIIALLIVALLSRDNRKQEEAS